MKSFVEFNQILVEGRYGSEHGHRKIWNEFRFNKTVKTASVMLSLANNTIKYA